MYPRNAASPERIAIGAVILIADGTPQSSGVTVTVRGQGGAEAGSAGTIAYGATGVIVYYTPTQGETDFTSFTVTASKASCIPACVTVITSASATPGYAGVDWAKVTNPTTALALTGTSIITTQKVDVETIKTQAVTLAGGVTIPAATLASTTNITAGTITTATNLTTNNDKTGYSLTAVTGLGAQTANITGNLSGSVGSVTGAVGSVTGLTAANLDTTVSSRATPAQVNTEVLDVLVTDTFAEPAAVPAATSSLKDKLSWLFTLGRNKITQTATTQLVRNDADAATVGTSTVSDDGVTATRGEFV